MSRSIQAVSEEAGDADAVIERLKSAVAVKTDAELAALLDVSRTTISNWRTRNVVPLGRIRPLCEKFGVPIDYLINGKLGLQKLVPDPLDTEILGYLFTLLDRYGFISLPQRGAEEAGVDPARRAAAEFVVLQQDTLGLMQRLMADRQLSVEDAKRAILNSKPPKPDQGAQ